MQSITGRTYTFHGKHIIGSGTYGNVRPVLRDDGKEYVVKIFHKHYPDLEIGVLREISIMKMLKGNKSNLVELEDIICMNNEEQTTGVIMKKYKCDLHDIIHTKRLKLRKRISIARKLIKAVAFLHYNGIIHRDIKLENILLDEKNNPFLCDFSLSKVFDGLSNDGTHTGDVITKLYRAPEIRDKQNYSYPVDIWSLGIVLYQLFTMKFLPCNSLDEIYSYFNNTLNKTSNNIIYITLSKMLDKEQEKRITIKELINSNFFDKKPKISKKFNYIDKYSVNQDVKDMCEYLDVKKDITHVASQIYIDKTKCSVESAVELASKIYETSCREIEYDYYPDEELFILEKMEFNLFV